MKGLQNARHNGRLELWQERPAILFDGAHNPAGAQALREFIDEFIKTPMTLVFGAMEDKKLAQMASVLFPSATRLVLTQLDNPRSAKVETVAKVAERYVEPGRVRTAQTVGDAIRIAKEITPDEELICVTGSLYLIGEVQSLLREEQNFASR